MIVKENTHILFIEPTGNKSDEPIIDDLTNKVLDAMLKATFNPHRVYRGWHTCVCGEKSSNKDFILPNGQITNSLAYHYIAEHRDEVPERELRKIRKL